MTTSYVIEDPWEKLAFRFSEMIKDGIEVKISYGGMEADVNFDSKALKNLSTLFEKRVPSKKRLGSTYRNCFPALRGGA